MSKANTTCGTWNGLVAFTESFRFRSWLVDYSGWPRLFNKLAVQKGLSHNHILKGDPKPQTLNTCLSTAPNAVAMCHLRTGLGQAKVGPCLLYHNKSSTMLVEYHEGS